MKIEFETRVADWREGALDATYLKNKFQVLATVLEKTKLKPGKFGEYFFFSLVSLFSSFSNKTSETWNLLPVGWTRLADPSGSGTYFANVITNETSWTWPPETQPQPTSPTPSTPPPTSITSPPATTSPPPTATIYSSAPVRYHTDR